MKVLVTGAKGMLGQDLCPILEDNGYEVIETDIDSLDITNLEIVKRVISEAIPDIVIHCAAYTNVDMAETESEKAKFLNFNGTENISKVCSALNITLVYISTDYVFDGNKQSPYLPEDIPNPINVYGMTKFAGEEAVKKYCQKYYIARTSWLYGHHGKNFVETMISLCEKDNLKVVDDQIGCPTWTCELANGIVKLLSDYKYGVYHVCGSGSTSWYGFAQEIFEQYGKLSGNSFCGKNLSPCKTSDFPRPAKRPAFSVMNNNNICRNWKIALSDYLNLRV